MSDEIIVFNREGAEQYKKIAREVARRMQNETPHRARWQQQKGGGGGGGSAGSCACVCIANGDIIVHGIETTSRWSFDMTAQIFKQTHGSITFPAGTYVVVWDSGTSTWALDIGADLTAAYLSGSDATSATTMDGTLTLTWSALGAAPSLQLCVDGTIPAPSGS